MDIRKIWPDAQKYVADKWNIDLEKTGGIERFNEKLDFMRACYISPFTVLQSKDDPAFNYMQTITGLAILMGFNPLKD